MNPANNHNLPIPSSLIGGKPFDQFIDFVVDEKNLFKSSVAGVKSRDMNLPNFSIRVIEGIFSQNTIFPNLEGEELLSSYIFLKGNIKTILPRQHWIIESFNRSQNFIYDPNKEFLHQCPANSPLHFIHFSYHAEYFCQFLSEQERWANQLKIKIDRKESILGDEYQPISFAQERSLQNIFDCPLEGKLGELMMETSIIQIILIQMHLLFNSQGCNIQPALPKKDIEVIQALKDYLSNTFLDDHSIGSLSKHFGTNTNKLMSHFKKVHGNSIFEYIIALRMEHARQLLLEKDLQVTEVARTLGYKNPNHFSAAFKKKFGVSPTHIKIKYRPANYKTQPFETTPSC